MPAIYPTDIAIDLCIHRAEAVWLDGDQLEYRRHRDHPGRARKVDPTPDLKLVSPFSRLPSSLL